MLRSILLVLSACLLFASLGEAGQDSAATERFSFLLTETVNQAAAPAAAAEQRSFLLRDALSRAAAESAATADEAASATVLGDVQRSRPLILPALYASYVGLQGLEIHCAFDAVRDRAHAQGTPVTGLGTRTAITVAAKAATTASTVYFVERLWRKNRWAAVATMVAVNGVTGYMAMRYRRECHHGDH